MSKQLLPLHATHNDPSAATLMPYGRESFLGDVINLISPVDGTRRPIMLATCSVKNIRPLSSNTAVCGSLAAGSGILYSVILPVLGSSLPTVPLPLPVYQIFPSRSGVMLCGKAFSGNAYSQTSPVFGLIRPTRLPNCPQYQIIPSGVCTGSRARWPSWGTFHSRKVIDASPRTRVGFKLIVRREMGRQILRDRVLGGSAGQIDHRADQFAPVLPTISRAASNHDSVRDTLRTSPGPTLCRRPRATVPAPAHLHHRRRHQEITADQYCAEKLAHGFPPSESIGTT